MKPTAPGNAMNETKPSTNQQPQPGSPNFFSSRHFLQSAAALSSLAGATANAVAADDAGKDKSLTPLNQPLGQDYVVVTQVPDENHFIHDPAMTILPNGHLIAAAPVWGRKKKTRAVFVSRSKDGGKTCSKVCEKPDWDDVALYVHAGRLYMFTTGKEELPIIFPF